MTVGIPNSRRTGPTCRMAGCIAGANMNVMPASSRARAATSTGASSVTPSCSRTSALPHCVVKERFPCFAIRTPAPAASSAAAVEIHSAALRPKSIARSDQAVAAYRDALAVAKQMMIAQPGDRVLVVFGAGHAFWLRHFAEQTPGFSLAEPKEFLR